MTAIALGFIVSPVCYLFVSSVKKKLGYDDSLDVFGVHCIGGIVGAIGTAIVANPAFGGECSGLRQNRRQDHDTEGQNTSHGFACEL